MQAIEGKDGGRSYEIQMGDSSECRSLRLLIDSKDKCLIGKRLSKQLIVAESTSISGAAEDDDSIDHQSQHDPAAPADQVPGMVVPYTHVDQVPDLRGRFKPYGAGTGKVTFYL